jgi:hypothetical protein
MCTSLSPKQPAHTRTGGTTCTPSYATPLLPTCLVCCLCRVLLPYVHILIPQAARADPYRRRDVHTKLRKLKHFIKERLPAEPAAHHHSLPSAGSDAAALAAAAGGVAAYYYHSHGQQHGSQHQQQYQQLPGGPWSGPGQQQMRQGVPVASSSAAGQLGSWHSGSTQQQQQQRGSIYGQGAAAAGGTGQLAGGSRASHDGGGSAAAAAAARAEAAATAAAAAKIQQEIGQVRQQWCWCCMMKLCELWW